MNQIFLLVKSLYLFISHHLHYHWSIDFFGALYLVLCVFVLFIIGKYSYRYLEGEKGYRRFWIFFSLFSAGLICCALSYNLKTFFLGWEMVGLASFS